MKNRESITPAEPAIYFNWQNKFEVLWKTSDRNSFYRYGCSVLKSPESRATTSLKSICVFFSLPYLLGGTGTFPVVEDHMREFG
jgi:hypothetical protein